VTTLVNLIVMLGMLVAVPVGLTLIDGQGLARLARYWPAAAAPGALALWLPRGAAATALASVCALATAVLAAQVPLRLARTRSLAPAEVAVLTALAAPSVAGLALVAERSGHRLFGFELDGLALTVDWTELLGAVVLTAGMWLVGLLTWRDLRTHTPERLTGRLLAVSAAVLVATMLLAPWWALGEASGLPHPTLT